MPVKIVVLDDGETWSGAGTVWTITDDALRRLNNGDEPSDLTDDDVLDCQIIDTDETEKSS